jgi:hypothetical protein
MPRATSAESIPLIYGINEETFTALERRQDIPATALNTETYNGPADSLAVNKRRGGEIVQRVRQPLITAIALLGISTIKKGVQRAITSRLAVETRGKYAQGIKGITSSVLTIAGVRYDKGAN